MYDRYWKPQFKWQLVEWLCRWFKEPRGKYERMGKKQLYAIYFRVRQEEYKTRITA